MFSVLRWIAFAALTGAAFALEAPRAARSVHLAYESSEAVVFCNAMIIDRTTPGSFFMACGWNTGYFGLQELGDGSKKVIFSVWDPTRGDDPEAVKAEERVECLYHSPDTAIKRFGGEGTGGQCMADFEWEPGKEYRFCVSAVVEGAKTAYSGYVWIEGKGRWKHLATFRVRTGGLPMTGLYSFLEDFRRDTKSAMGVRKARFGNIWVMAQDGNWKAITKARFTASDADFEASETIDAGMRGDWFFLRTGGHTTQSIEFGSALELGGH